MSNMGRYKKNDCQLPLMYSKDLVNKTGHHAVAT